jgi:outer membrane lipoprotein carrier protein
MSKSKPSLFLITFILIMGAFTQKASCITADELALQVEKKYRSFESLSVDFIKVVRSEIFDSESSVGGKMIFKNPDKFRIETKKETIVSDGKFIWTYSVENEQVIKNLTERSSDFFTPYQYLSNFRSEYIPHLEGEGKIEGKRSYKLLLSSKKKEAFIKKMTVWVDKESLLAKKLEYEDSNDNQITLTFRRIKTNHKFKDSEFVFEAPPGVEQVDLSE